MQLRQHFIMQLCEQCLEGGSKVVRATHCGLQLKSQTIKSKRIYMRGGENGGSLLFKF